MTSREDAPVPTGWQPLGGDRGEGLVLALDFEAVGRPEACFADLAPLLEPPQTMWMAQQPAAADVTGPPGPAYLAHWRGGLPEDGTGIRAVLGYCTGAVFAAALAGQVASRQGTPPATVLLDPEPATPATMRKQFDHALRGLTAMVPGNELSWVQGALDQASDSGDLPSLGTALSALYEKASAPAFERVGLKPDYQAGLIASFRSLMSYLAAAGDLGAASGDPGGDAGRGWASATAIISATAPDPATGAGRRIRVDADHAGLLRSPAAARLVSGLLG
jgi:hypothetical protein